MSENEEPEELSPEEASERAFEARLAARLDETVHSPPEDFIPLQELLAKYGREWLDEPPDDSAR